MMGVAVMSSSTHSFFASVAMVATAHDTVYQLLLVSSEDVIVWKQKWM